MYKTPVKRTIVCALVIALMAVSAVFGGGKKEPPKPIFVPSGAATSPSRAKLQEIPIEQIEGFKIGHATNTAAATGCTAIICETGAIGGVDNRGGAPASRETDLLKPINMVERIHAVMLSGGSAYGLDAAGGAMKYLEERKIGFDVGVGVVPIVVGACIFDLGIGKADVRPDAAMGYTACKNAGAGPVAVGNVGAGTGAQVGQYLGPERTMKSGLGAYAVDLGGVKVGAIVAVNCMGDVFDIDTGKVIAGILTEDKTDIDNTERIMFEEIKYNRDVWSGANTTIGCIITNAKLTKTQASRLATVAHNGLAQAIRPVHTSADGDTIFVMANGDYEVNPDSLGALATEVMARAINRAVRSAESAYGRPAASDFSR